MDRHTELAHLVSGVGHHVINALCAIVSNAEVLRLAPQLRQEIDPVAVADLIVETALEASEVTRRLIELTRPLTTVGFEPTDLRALVSETIETERRNAPETIQWRIDLQPVPTIPAIPDQLRRMIHHVINNAIEAFPPSGGTLKVWLGLDDRSWIVLEIQDDGPGMVAETQRRAVEPFFTTKPGHVGVGLPIAHGIWRRHHGTLSIQTAPGAGTQLRLAIEPSPVSSKPETPVELVQANPETAAPPLVPEGPGAI
jgi:signal transduction histidine kinase